MHNNADDIKEPEYEKGEVDIVIHENSSNPLQLTPTGKISRAKTRVYTQRYRKAWEQMPDFKGWLTSVPHQPTRAFCTYCRKNLHAHRLSLLKHTCTMKHQRCGLMHQKAADAKAAADEGEQLSLVDIKMQNDSEEVEEVEPKVMQHFKLEADYVEEEVEGEGDDDEDDENIEYVVERLDDDEYAEEEDEDSIIPVAKKIKTDDKESPSRQDTLAEAMVHVHDDYLDEHGDSINVELEMVVESTDPSTQEIRIVSVHSEREDGVHDEQIGIENYENDKNSNEYSQDHDKEQDHGNTPLNDHPGTTCSCKSSVEGESSDAATEIDEPDQNVEKNQLSMPVRKDYLTRPSTARAISVLPGSKNSNGSPVVTTKKTITLTSGGKTVTLDSSSITPYTGSSRFLLNTKGHGTAIVIPNKGNLEARNDVQTKIAQDEENETTRATTYSVPGTSQPTPKKHIILKSMKSMVAKKPCLSTHVLDTSKGLPVGGLQISLYKLMDGRWTFINESTTNGDGRCAGLIDVSKCPFTAGRYKLHFDVDKYFTLRRIETIYPFIEIIFDVKNPTEHYHIPVLISPFGYTTYRGS